MDFGRETTAKVARLARLKLSDSELDSLAGNLQAILGYVDQLSEVETAGVEPLAHPLPLRNCFRDDVRQPSLPVEEGLVNAPKRAGEFFSVPAILDR